MRMSDRVPPEHWPDCIGFTEWYFPFESDPEQPANDAPRASASEFWPESDPSAFPYFAYQLEQPH